MSVIFPFDEGSDDALELSSPNGDAFDFELERFVDGQSRRMGWDPIGLQRVSFFAVSG